MDLRVRLLGTVEVRIDGTFRSVGAPQQGLLIAALTREPGRPVSGDILIDRLWDEPPPSVQNSLSVLLSRMRRTLGGATRDAPALRGSRRTYLLTVEPHQVDTWHYLRLHTEAHGRADRGDAPGAVALLDEAAGLWRGEPLTGIAGGFAAELRRTFEEHRLAGELLRAELDLGRGRHFETVARLRRCHADHPTHERVVELLALALYADGRAIEATRLLQEFSHRLIADAGSGLGPRLRHLQQGILHHRNPTDLLPPRSRRVRAPRPAEPARPGPADARPTATPPGAGRPFAGPPFAGPPDNLPPDTPWVGREQEVAALLRVLERPPDPDRPPVCTVSSIDGMAGVGKTALAVHLGHRLRDRYPDGRLLVDLRGFAPGAEPLSHAAALRALLRATGLLPENLPSTTEQLAQLWRDVMRDLRAVVILDNARDSAQIRPLLLPRFRGVTLVTSRNRISGPPGVVALSLDTPPEDEAIALFERRITPSRRPDRSETAGIVRLCGRLPLAVELVATRYASRPAWSGRDLLVRLERSERRLDEIRDGDGRRINQAFDLSYRCLDGRQRQVFRRIGAHIGGEFGVGAAAALSDLAVPETEAALEELLGAHLVEEPVPDRYRLHDLLGSYARELLRTEDQPNARETARERLFRHYLTATDQADRISYPYRVRIPVPEEEGDLPRVFWADHGDVRRWWQQEGANLLATLEYVRAEQAPERAALYTHTLAGFLESEGYLTSGLPMLRRAAEHWRQTAYRRAEAAALHDLGRAANQQGDWPEAVRVLERAREIAHELGDEECETECLQELATPYFRCDGMERAMTHIRESLRLAEKNGDLLRQCRGLNKAAAVLSKVGRFDDALSFLRRALVCSETLGDPQEKSKVLHNMGISYRDTGDFQEAERHIRRALDLARTAGDRTRQATHTVSLAQILDHEGRHHEALRTVEAVLPLLRSLDAPVALSTALNSYGTILRGIDRPAAALPYHEAALSTARTVGVRAKEIQALRELGRSEFSCGRRAAALRHLSKSLDLARDARSDHEVRECERVLAEIGHGVDEISRHEGTDRM